MIKHKPYSHDIVSGSQRHGQDGEDDHSTRRYSRLTSVRYKMAKAKLQL